MKHSRGLPYRFTLPQSGCTTLNTTVPTMLRDSTCSYKELNGHLHRPDGRDNQSQPAPLSADRTFLGTTDDYTGPWSSTVSLESASTLPHLSPPLYLARESSLHWSHIPDYRPVKIQIFSPAPIHVGATNSSSCPVSALRAYLRHRSVPSTSPLFLFPNGSCLTVRWLQKCSNVSCRTQTSIQAIIAFESGLQHLLLPRGYPITSFKS